AFTVLDGGLRSLLVVHHEVHGQPGAVRPLGVRRIRSISNEIAVVASRHVFPPRDVSVAEERHGSAGALGACGGMGAISGPPCSSRRGRSLAPCLSSA